MFTANDPFWFLDIDGALQADGTWSPLAIDLCNRFHGAAVEVSQSGKGLHIIGTGTVPDHGCKNIPLGLEFYHELRFVALTGIGAIGSAAFDHSAQLAVVVPHYFPVGFAANNGPDDWTTEPVAEWDGPLDDDDLIRLALSSADRSAAAAFGGEGVTFRDLWEAKPDALAKRWPGDNGPYDASSADASLATRLAFWTGKDCERIRTLMYKSALARDKWDLRGEYYLPRTIQRACGVSTDVAKGSSAPLAVEPSAEHECYPGSLSTSGQPSEESLAREFVKIHGGRWRFDHTVGIWYNWNGHCWARDNRRLVVHLMADHLRAAVRAGFPPRIANSKTMRGLECLAKSNPSIALTNEIWDSDPWLLGTPAGTVDLRTGNLHLAKPEEHITMLASVAPRDGEPIVWLRFLNEALSGDVETIRFLQRLCGYCLTGITREHALAFIHGPGGNGKSVFLNTIMAILGDYAKAAAMETFTLSRHIRHSTELAMLKGARLVTVGETEQGRGWDEAKIKSLTGGDPITARYMRQDNFTFRPQFKLIIAGNHAPSLREVGEAMRRRLIILPFTVTPLCPDLELEQKLREEWPLILAWMIKGCQSWQATGLHFSAAITEATDRYFADQDTFGHWLEECCEIAPDHCSRPTPLFQSWSTFALAAGETAGPQKDFKTALELRGVIRAKSNGARIYRGVRLRETQ